MKPFMDEEFLLESETASRLFHTYAEKTPILDYHCHISPKEIAEDRKFDNIAQVWLGGDHYKWRFMRSCGVEEKYITGDASDHDKFVMWAKCLGKAIGNPLYHWSHLELQRYFDYHGHLCEDTAEEVWEICNKKLADPSMSAKGIIKQSGVTLICTTDDPIDDLCWHKQIREDSSFDVKVLPAWRPDKAMNIEKPDYKDYLKKLAAVSGMDEIKTWHGLRHALKTRMEFFKEQGCVISDHALEFVMYAPATEDEVEAIFLKRLNNIPLTKDDEYKFKTAFMTFVSGEYVALDWAMQLHYGCKRDNNTRMYKSLGPDTGYDCINNNTPSSQCADFLDSLEKEGKLPRTILYSLNPADNEYIGTIIGCFQDSTAVAKIQQGSAWWFNDHIKGMTDQIKSLASLGNLSGFVGMLTDSRSFLSYTRHEYFRRILCNILGDWVEKGKFPEDYKILGEIVEDISYYNAVRYFKFPLDDKK
ncbi:MAG: glucuronate isomerase [Lachnospiraceae bacterium]|nr:glucuronate isomerase [Lachnospiraceae bacterium]